MVEATPAVRRALVSVSDKSKLEVLARALIRNGIEVLSTGGTYQALAKLGVSVRKVSEHTGAPEILGGRVKTLHPKIHGGILALPTQEHRDELQAQAIDEIDLVVVNLYPFAATVADPDKGFAEAIENIDIGGPTMVRAAAKNWQRVTVVVDPDDYERIDGALAESAAGIPESLRMELSAKAFAHTAAYDAAIANYLQSSPWSAEQAPQWPPQKLFLAACSIASLRYGENPHQSAGFYALEAGVGQFAGLEAAIQHQGKPLSYNNLLDADAALALARDLSVHGRAAAVFKHVSPCGAAVARNPDESLAQVYARARDADAESAFGGIVGLTDEVDADTAEKLVETFLEVIVAPSYSAAAREILANKKNLRVLELPSIGPSGVHASRQLRLRSVAGGLLVQTDDAIGVAAREARVASKAAPSADDWASLDLGVCVCKHVRSNAIVLVRDGVTVGIGGGQTSRVEAVRQALIRAGDSAAGSIVASDAFFPFADSIELFAKSGVRGVIQPGASIRDEEVVKAADEAGIILLMTGERHFRH